MAVSVTVNGTSFSIPNTGDENWGDSVTAWVQAISSGTLQKAGGTFTLTGELDLGASFGIKTAYIKSRATNPGSNGVIRLGNAENITFRNAGNTADLSLTVSATNKFTFNSIELADLSSAQTLTNKTIDIAANTVTNVVNATIAANAAIEYAKLAALTVNRALVSNGSGVVSVSAVTATELGYLSGVTSAIQTQIDSKQASGSYVTSLTGDVTASGPGAAAATIAAGAIDNAKVSASAAIAYSKLNLTGAVVNADISASAAIAYSKLNLAGSLVNADVSASAAIARSKLASGTANHVVINDGSGVASSEAQLAISRGGTGQSTAAAALDALAPTTTKGDLVVRNTTTNTRLPVGSDGQILTADSTQATGVKWAPSAASSGALLARYVYTSSTTYTKNANASYINVIVVGGGGGGGSGLATGASQMSVGGGGGGGGYVVKKILNSSVGATETVTVGAGGARGSIGGGSAGGSSSFGAHCTALGGAGGAASSASSAERIAVGGAGDGGTGGDYFGSGNGGAPGLTTGTSGLSGGGGGSVLGGGGRGLTAQVGSGRVIGDDAKAYGGGGGGGINGASQANPAGGFGFAGIVIVEEYS